MTMDRGLEVSYRFCERLARREARNFYYAFLLMPRPERRSMCALYAFLRHTDDLADEPGGPREKSQALGLWREELARAISGEISPWPGLVALAHTARRHGIPTELLMKSIDGACMDIVPRRYATFADLADYCYHVASVVGLACLHIWGYRSEGGKAERLAESCGVALQLTNIIRDVREDAQNGRVYLPEEDLLRFQVGPDELLGNGPPNERVRALLAFEAERAYAYYEEAQALAPLVDRAGRPVFRAIVGIYRALLDEIVRRDYRVLDERVSIGKWRKLAVAFQAVAAGRAE
jgi:phytoene synthase